MTDTTITSLGDGELLVYDTTSSKWINQTLSEAGIAPVASPGLTGTPTAPTASAATNSTQIATTAYVTTAVSNLVDSAPGALNTLNELAAALGDDANFSTTVTNSIATKLPLAGGTMTGKLTLTAGDDDGASPNPALEITNGTVYISHDEATIIFDEGQKMITTNDGNGNFSIIGGADDDGVHVDSVSGTSGLARMTLDSDGADGVIYHAVGPRRSGGSAANLTHALRIANNSTTGLTWITGSATFPGSLTSTTSTIFHDNYHPNADKWTTARTLSLTGDVTGSVSWDGSGNASLAATVANDSHTHVFGNITSTSLSSSSNLDDYTTRALAHWGSSNPSNSPSAYGAMFVIPDGNQPQQLVQTYGGAANKVSLYGRRKTSGTWDTSWTQYFSDHYHPNADKWTTSRTLTLSGEASGSVSWDGSANATLSVTLNDSALDDQYVTVGARHTGNADSLVQTSKASIRIWDVSTATDDPSGATDGLILSAGWDSSSWGIQQYHDFHSNDLYLRSKNNNSMTSWDRVFHDTYHPNADTLTTARTINGVSFDGSANVTIADSTKLPLAGGTMTGTLTLGSNPSNAGELRLNDTSTTAYTVAFKGTGTRGYAFEGSASSADYNTTFSNAGTGDHNVNINGHLGIGGTATDANWSDATYGNTEVSIDGGGGYGVLHFRGDGAGSSETRYSVGVGDGIFYMAYDDNDGVHRVKVNTSHQLIVNETSGGSGEKRVFHDGYHPNADTLTTARTINGVSFNGSANITVADSTKLPLSGGTMTGELQLNARLDVGDGSSADTEIRVYKSDNNVSDHIQFYNGTTRVGEIGCEDTTWLRINQETNKNIYTPRYIRADAGFFVDSTAKGINGSGNFIGGTITGASDANVSNWDTAYTTANAALPKAGGAMTGSLKIDTDNQQNGALHIENNVTDTNNDFYFAQEIIQTLSGSQAATGDREQGGIYMDINSTNTGGDTSQEHRAYGIYLDMDSTGDADNVTGIYSNVVATPTTGTTSNVWAGYFWAEDNGGAGSVSNVHGIQSFAYSDNSNSDTDNMYGGYFKVYNAADSAAIGQAHGVYSEVEITAGSGDIYGNTYVYRAELDNNAGEQSNSTYLYYGNYAGTLPSTAWGVYIVDTVDNYFAGSLQIGDKIAHAGDTDTYFQFHGANLARMVLAGAEVQEWGANYTLFSDSDQVRLGSGSDFRMYFDGTNTYFRNYAHAGGNIYFQGEDTEGTNHGLVNMRCDTSSPYVQLLQNGGERLRTLSGGVGVTGLTVGDVDATPHNPSGLQVSMSSDEKIVLSGSSQPYIRWQEGTADRAYIRWSSGGSLDFRNQENGHFKFQSTVDGQASRLILLRNDTTTVSGNELGSINFGHTDGDPDYPTQTISQLPARILAEATETTGSGDDGARLRFFVKATNANKDTNSVEALRIDQNKAVTFYGNAIFNGTVTGISAGAEDDIFWENNQAVTSNYTITNNKNAMSAGPITINSGVTVTVGDGEAWTVV
jgi:hypothetical protein